MMEIAGKTKGDACMSIAVIYGGTRPNGNTETLADRALDGLPAEKIYLRDHLILPIEDRRHEEGGFLKVDDEYDSLIDRMIPHETLVFATPIYWYGMSGPMKNFVDRWSQTLRDANYPDFRKQMSEKKGFVVAVGGNQPTVKGLPLILQFQLIFQFFGANLDGYVIGYGHRPGDILNDQAALGQADELRKKLTELA